MISGWRGRTDARPRRPLIVLLAATLVWILLDVARLTLHAGDGLAGDYFTNSEWNGQPEFSVVDAAPSTARMRQRWNGVPPERFSVRWTGFLAVGRSGLYHFATTSDDGSQLIVDNHVVVDNTGPHSLRTRSGSIRLDRGSYPVVLQYVQYGAVSALDWSWSRDDGGYATVPAWALSQRRADYKRVVSARVVRWALWGVAIAIVLVAAWYVRVGLSWEAVRLWAAARQRDVTASYPDTASLVFSLFIIVAILFMPWEGSGQYPFYRSVEGSIRYLDRTAITMLGRFGAFQANINSPQTGEYVLGPTVEEMLAMLRGHGVERYQLSDSIAANSWVLQQIVASAWPRKLEPDAKARFVLNAEPATPSCILIDKQAEVSLVYCR